MANEEHVRIVLEGNDAIAAWRSENPGARLDLRRSDFTKKSLPGRDLQGADLQWADCRWADLPGADFTGATLVHADFHKSDLSGAIFERADLAMANFEDANLTSARFAEAVLDRNRFLNTDFRSAEGLSACIHRGPSLLDRDTLVVSPDLPREFLQGCGLFMPYRATVFRIVVGSPSDVAEERLAVRDTIYSWNDNNSQRFGAVMLPVLWETSSTPEIGDRPQAIINRQIIDDGHILVCLFWTRIGTPTGEAQSGTIEEIERFAKSGKPVMIYFCTRAFPHSIDLDQLRRLRAFQDDIRRRGLVDDFAKTSDLVQKLQRHLSSTLERLMPPAATND
ncbi:MAG: pentapeptide repeat-containing protein [Planctomycetes bacterium]|nr:pentapeptide repeat-containing protein [Planctomycetota bacterium]